MKGNARKRLHDIAEHADCIYMTTMRERIKYGKYSTDVSINIDNAIQWSNSPDTFNLTIKFGKHQFCYSHNQVVYSYWKTPSKPDVYDIIPLPDINKFALTEESYFQYMTIFDFKYFELEDLQALDKIRKRFQTIWSDYLLRW